MALPDFFGIATSSEGRSARTSPPPTWMTLLEQLARRTYRKNESDDLDLLRDLAQSPDAAVLSWHQHARRGRWRSALDRRRRQVEGNSIVDPAEPSRSAPHPLDAVDMLRLLRRTSDVQIALLRQPLRIPCTNDDLGDLKFFKWKKSDGTPAPSRMRGDRTTGVVHVKRAPLKLSGYYVCQLTSPSSPNKTEVGHVVLVGMIPDLCYVVTAKYQVGRCNPQVIAEKKIFLTTSLCTTTSSSKATKQVCWVKDVAAVCQKVSGTTIEELILAFKVVIPMEHGYPECSTSCLWEKQLNDLRMLLTTVDEFFKTQARTQDELIAQGKETDDTSAYITSRGYGPRLWFRCRAGFSFSAASPFMCLPCVHGTHFRRDRCLECAEGTYQNQFSQASCKTCPPGMVTKSVGSITKRACFDPVSNKYAEGSDPIFSLTDLPAEEANRNETSARSMSKSSRTTMSLIVAACVLTFAVVLFCFLRSEMAARDGGDDGRKRDSNDEDNASFRSAVENSEELEKLIERK